MADNMRIQVKGLGTTADRLANPAAFQQPMRKFFIRTTAVARNSAKRRTPRWSGALRNAWKVEFDQRPLVLWARVFNPTWYAKMIDSGTKPHMPKVTGRLQQWAESKGLNPYAVAANMRKGKGRGKRPRAVRGRFMRFIARKSVRKRLPDLTAQAAKEIGDALVKR